MQACRAVGVDTGGEVGGGRGNCCQFDEGKKD